MLHYPASESDFPSTFDLHVSVGAKKEKIERITTSAVNNPVIHRNKESRHSLRISSECCDSLNDFFRGVTLPSIKIRFRKVIMDFKSEVPWAYVQKSVPFNSERES